MTHPALIERITRSLAYMLRHQPEQFDLELDEFGWADLREVVRALNERLGEPTSAEDVQEAVSSGDRQRYEIDRGMIRALYGHSIDVQPGEPAQPPELLYVGVSRQDAERAERFGLRPGRRRFLHLALTSEDALETAARSSEDAVLVKVHAMDAWEEGINFYDRKALFLSDPIPTHYLEITEVAPQHEEHSHEHSHAAAHAHEAPAWGGQEEAPTEEREGVENPDAPRGFAPPPPGEGGGRRRRGRRGGRGRGRDFPDDRPRPPADAGREPAFHERPQPPAQDDRPRHSGRDERPRQGYGGGGPRPGGGAPRPAHSGGGFGGGHGGGHGGPRGEHTGPRGERGGFREDRGRPAPDDRAPRQDDRAPRQDDRAPRQDDRAPRQDDRPPRHDDRPPRHDRPRHEDRGPARDRGPAPDRGGWQPREERPRPPAPEGDFGSGMAEPRRAAPPPPPPAPPPRVEAPKPAPKPARRETTSDDAFGAGL